jgi:alcohol dehydrogenase YqhD (iron-dependent ADH family)
MSAVFPEIAHGVGLGVLFPAWILFTKNLNAPTFARWTRHIRGANTKLRSNR